MSLHKLATGKVVDVPGLPLGIAKEATEDVVNYHALKDAACDYAKSRVAFGWLTPD